MSSLLDVLAGSSTVARVGIILLLAAAAHFLVRLIRWSAERIILAEPVSRTKMVERRPKVATLTTIVVSALTFTIYFSGIGLVLAELGVNLTAYVASASVIGLAVGFGSQGFVQDVVVGLTLIFSDVLNVGDMVDLSGQTGRVQRVGLRFTTLTNFLDQSVNVPNRNIAQINRYRRGYVRAYVDVQLPDGEDETELPDMVMQLANGMRSQFPAIILDEPESMGVRSTADGSWKYVRIKFKLWPGQGALIENTFRQRVLTAMRGRHADYADWMVAVTYRARDARPASDVAQLRS